MDGRSESRRGIQELYLEGSRSTWKSCHGAYRCLLFLEGEARPAAPGGEEGKRRAGVTALQVQAVKKQEGDLSTATLLRARVRHFTQGLALGRQVFVEDVFERNRSTMRVKRKVGARKPKGADLGAWRTLADLRNR